MKFRTTQRKRVRANLDLTPLIDVVFLLVLFFMLSSTFVVQNSIPVELPQAQGSSLLEARDISVTLTRGNGGEGSIFVDNVELENIDQLGPVLAAKRAANPDILVLIRADEGVPTGRTVEVLGIAYAAGIKRSLIAAQPPRSEP